MKRTKRRSCVARLGILAATLTSLFAQAGVIDVNSSMAAAVNQNANAKAAVLKAIGINDAANWQLKSFKVSKMRQTGLKMELPKARFEFVASKEVVNCDATGTMQTIMLSKEVTNSATVTKADTFDASVSATVGMNAGFVSGSATATAGLSMTDTNASTKMESVSVTQSTTITFADVGGRITVLQALKMQSDQIPWTASFTPADEDQVQVTAERLKPPGEACLWEHANYTGHKKCYAFGRQGDIMEMSGRTKSLSVPDGLVLRIWKNKGRSGDMYDATSNVALDRNWTNNVGSIQVLAATRSGSAQFAAIKNSIPEDKRTFTAKGTMQMSKTAPDSTKIVNYPMRPEDWKDTCSMAPSGHEMAFDTGAKAIRASGTKGAAPATAAAKAGPKIRTRDLTEDQLKLKLKDAKPLPG